MCDVSGSVARVVEFLLLFLYSINEAVQDIRTFAFSGRLVEVSDMLNEKRIEEAMQDAKKAGKVTVTGRIVVSANGRTRTVTTSGRDSKGRRINTIAVYDKG